jgi:hypothetical protein
MFFPCSGILIYSVPYKNEFEALNLLPIIFVTYVEIQLPGSDIWLLSITQSFG